ncbi:MAG: EAL domain-containing protein [Colwellia sp.]|nr:EAL domain-containing protein [Colwellia sp.]
MSQRVIKLTKSYHTFCPISYLLLVNLVVMLKYLHPIPIKLLAALLILLVMPASFAKMNNLTLSSLSVKDGLSQGTINAVIEDDAGFIWLATSSGINIYDGNVIRPFLGPKDVFKDKKINNLIKDNQGLIWISSGTNTLYTYDPKTGDYQLILSKIAENKDYSISHVLIGDQGNIWILTSKSLDLYNKNTGEYQEFINFEDQLPNRELMYQMSQYDGVLYLSSRIGVFAINKASKQWKKLPKIEYDNTNVKTFNPASSSVVYTLHASSRLLYIGTADGFFTIDTSEIKAYIVDKKVLNDYQLLIENTATRRLFSDDKLLYIATDKGLFTANLIDNSIEFILGFSDYYDDITDNKIQAIIKDRDGTLWLGSPAKGVYLWNPKRELFTNYRYKSKSSASLSYNAVWSTFSNPENENLLWIGTSNGLNAIDLKQNKVTQYMVNTDSKSIYTQSYIYIIQTLNEQQLLISTPKGVRLFDIVQQQYIKLPFSPMINDLLAFNQYYISMVNDYLWLANEKGFYRINIKTQYIERLEALNTQFPNGSGLRMLDFLPGNDAAIFTSNNALWSYDHKKKHLKQIYQQPNILKEEVLDISNWAIDGQNILWLSFSTKGIVGLALDTFEAKYFYNHANSIIDDNVYGLMTDIDGDVWFSSHNGLYMLDDESHHISHYSTENGLGATEFNSRAYAKINDDLFAYGSMEGVSIFSPSQLKNAYSEENFKVQISKVNILSRHLITPLIIANDTVFNLNYNDVGIRVDYSTFSFLSDDKIEYDFRLTGETNLVYPPSKESYITFASLPSGDTSLTARAKSPKTGHYSAPIILHFKVSYAPWRSPMAFTLYAVIAALMFMLWYRYRQVQRQLLLDVHEQVKYREKRLQLALTGSNLEVWDWQSDDDLIFGKRITLDLGYKNEALFYSFNNHVKLIHPDDRENFLTLWQLFIANANLEDNFSCSYRLKTVDGQWLWYKDLAKIVAIDSEGKPSRVTGSYTNITESRANEERAQFYGDAFKQTQDWVLIIDEKISRVTANHSMRRVFGWTDEVFAFDANILGVGEKRQAFYQHLLLSLKVGEHWSGEELITTANNEQHHVVVNISAARNSVTNNIHYICIFTDISAQKSAENELRFLANYDYLTGLPNRSLLLERIQHAINHAKRHKNLIALFFIDLDRFKQVNDSLGHDYGDLLLKEITKRLLLVLRTEDTVARIGGDEFVILLESFNTNQLGTIAQKIIASIEEPVQLKNNKVSVGASIGIALYPEDAVNSEKLLRNADMAMYHAKQLGRNNFQFFTDEMNFKAKERLSQESKIKQAVKNNEFINYYQPIVNAHTGKAVGFELLMRWKSPEGMIPPDQFIPLSEELGLIIEMTESALDRGLRVLKQWCKVREGLYLSVNLAAQHFAKDSLVPYIERLLHSHHLPASSLRIEVTESALLSEPEKSIQTMCALSKLGVSLALDDFGTGFSSLSYLKQLPLDIIKVDRSFVEGIGKNKADEAIVDTTLVLAKRLNMYCIAEGVETKEQLRYLVAKNCHYIQGYLYSKPLPGLDVMKMLMINETDLIVTRPCSEVVVPSTELENNK